MSGLGHYRAIFACDIPATGYYHDFLRVISPLKDMIKRVSVHSQSHLSSILSIRSQRAAWVGYFPHALPIHKIPEENRLRRHSLSGKYQGSSSEPTFFHPEDAPARGILTTFYQRILLLWRCHHLCSRRLGTTDPIGKSIALRQ